ncbi:MAG TPA: prepilin-type N-terminal cleavage/methylation domain-containing protein [Candidatus Binataceae bacterium]|nr:prepilin-type N-terminal cleavage/methylation domain-containing protein [Candidatus Binataceae bacterium]
MSGFPPRAGRAPDLRRRSPSSRGAPGFTLLEIAVVLFIMGLMITLALPYLGGFRYAKLKSESRRLAGRATFLFDKAAGQKVILRLVFDIDRNGYYVTKLDPYAVTPVNVEPSFTPDHSPGSMPVLLPADVRIRDVSVEGIGSANRGIAFCQFYPEGYVDATVVHLMDASGNVMTLAFNPLTGLVGIADGDVEPDRMFAQ